ncbi:MAG: phosphoglucosamine mutase [Pseudohongiellaceae bacterium]|jgi:phosphoglucosamine mutase
MASNQKTAAKQKQYFGTDGIRGTVGTAPITPDFMLKLGWAAGRVFAQQGNGRNKILIGKDTRISGYMFEAALEAGVTAAGVDIILTGPMPTPAIAYLTRTLRAQAGIVISASHNAFQDNGIKFFSGQGTKLPDEIELAIEAQLTKNVTTVASETLGKASRMNDAAGRYIEFCKSTVGTNLKFNGLKIVVDCAHGSTYHIAPAVFEELGAKVKAIGVSPDGLNINLNSGSTSPQRLAEAVLEEKADLGIAFDGDGDRVIMVDHNGQVVDGDEVLYVIARDRRKQNIDFGGVVGTAMTNLGLELALDALGVPFARAKVGDRYVMSELLQRGWRLGGESSGHIICLDITTTGDGILAAIQALAAIVRSEQPLADLRGKMRKFPQSMVNVKLPRKIDLSGNTAVQSAVSDVEAKLGSKGRVLLRPSGTEPVVRVMVEGEDLDTVNRLAQELSELVAAEVASAN